MAKTPKHTKLPASRNPTANRQQMFGKALYAEPRQGWEQGTVLDYAPDTQTYLVKTSSGRPLTEVVRLYGMTGEIGVLPRGTIVVVHHELGFPVIQSVLKFAPAIATQELAPTRVSEVRGVGGEDPVYAGQSKGAGRSVNEPQDVLGDDWLRMSRDGNMVGVLSGGVNVVKSGQMAQVRTHALGELVEILSSTYRHLTAMGDLKIQNDGGKTSLIWRAGADQMTETGPNAQKWTLRLDVGATGDLFNFEVTTPAGQTLARIHLGADGRVEITGVGGVDINGGNRAASEEVIDADKDITITGSRNTLVEQDENLQISGARNSTISKDDKSTVGGSQQTTISADKLESVGGVHKERVLGGFPPTPGTQVGQYEYVNGGLEVVLGNPLSGGLPGMLNTAQFVNYGGGFNFVVQPTATPPGNFTVVTTLPASVQLGASGAAVPNPSTGKHSVVGIAPFGAMMFEPFAIMMAALLTWLDAHTHLTVVGPTTPAAASLTGPVTPIVSPLLIPIRSIRVAIGL